MADIYQQIWDADQSENGLKPVTHVAHAEPSQGYVLVDEMVENQSEHSVLKDVVIPDEKRDTYDLCHRLFDNFTLDQTKAETDLPEEAAEVHNLLEAIINTAPMRLARDYVSRQTGEDYSLGRWYSKLVEIWFRTYDQGNNQDLSGFEHVVVGEQKGGTLGGYHFWYKYYLDDRLHRDLIPDGHSDNITLFGRNDFITYRRTRYDGTDGRTVPEVVTLEFQWDAPDYDARRLRPLYKKIGGFWVGCSIEGLMALGTARFIAQAASPKEAVINGGKYQLKLYRSEDGRSLRTFYPVYMGGGEVVEDGQDVIHPSGNGVPVKIVAACVNPIGHDPNQETVSLLNVTAETVSCTGWHLMDKNGRRSRLNQSVAAGQFAQVGLEADGMQLSNKGGTITLLDSEGKTVDNVTYTRGQARKEGWTVAF